MMDIYLDLAPYLARRGFAATRILAGATEFKRASDRKTVYLKNTNKLCLAVHPDDISAPYNVGGLLGYELFNTAFVEFPRKDNNGSMQFGIAFDLDDVEDGDYILSKIYKVS
jgi:hypothetical protein